MPPQVRALTIQHEAEISEDAADRIFALLGTLLHGNLETYANSSLGEIAEEKLELSINGWTVVGKYDLSEAVLAGELLTDYKLTSVWAIKDGVKPEWEAQLNVYSHLIRAAGRQVNQIQIVAIARDWSKMKARFDKDYPQQQVKVMMVPLWTPDQTEGYIVERLRLHETAQTGSWPDCSEEERWARPTQYALMKVGQKRAVKLFDNKSTAERHIAKNQYVQERLGISIRCELYCQVSGFCQQWQRIKEQAKLTKGDNT